MPHPKANFEGDLSRRWRPVLMAFFMRRVSCPAEAEDLTQEVFLRMMSVDEELQRPEAFVFQIARNLLADRIRKQAVRNRHSADAATVTDRQIDWLDPHSIASGREQLALFTAALDALPERLKTIFILYRFENLSQEMIGSVYGITASAVKQQVAKAMMLLARRMRAAQ